MRLPIRSPVVVVLLLLPGLAHPWNPEYLYNTILRFTKLIGTQEFLMFYCAECKDARIDRFVARIHRAANIPQYVTTNSTAYKLRNATKRNYMAIVFVHSINDPIFKVHDATLRGWHFYLGIIVVLEPIDDLNVAEELLMYLYKKRFANTHVYFACSNATDHFLAFRTYPHFQLTNRTLFNIQDLSKDFNRGVAGHVFKTPIRADVLRVFRFQNHAGKTEVQGTSYRVFKTFMNHMDGRIEDYPMDNSTHTVNMKEVIQLIRDEKIEISTHAYALFDKTDVDQSYPLLVVQWCIMVPSFNAITSYLYPLKPFDWKVWALYFVAILSFVVTVFCYERFTLQKASFSEQLLVGISLMLNIAAPRTFRNPSMWEFFLLSTIFLHTAIVTFFYTSFLGSILTVNLFRQQINNMADLIAANLPVMMIDYEYEFLRNVTPLAPEFEELILPVDTDTFSQHRNAMNNSYAYLTTDDRWHFIALQQKYLKQPKFRLSDICFGSYHMGFPMQIDSPLWRDLEYFIYRVHSSGLYQYYESIAFDYAVQGGYAQRLTSVDEYQAAGMQHLLMAFQLLILLWAISSAVFVGEVVLGKRTKKSVLIKK